MWHTGLLAKLSVCLSAWVVLAVELLLRDHHFHVLMGNKVNSWRRQKNRLPQGSVLALTLFSMYTNDLPIMKSHRFIYADDTCCATQATTFTDLDNTLTTDTLSSYCQIWRLKPKTMTSVSSSQCLCISWTKSFIEWSVHEAWTPQPVYLAITLDQTLSHRAISPKLQQSWRLATT